MAAGNLLAFSQVTSTSSISGAVVDPSGAVVAGATISVRNEATGEESSGAFLKFSTSFFEW
jgi:hypothetical protein